LLGDDCNGILNDRISTGRWPLSEINVTPLIDVLLIIFMAIVPVMPHGLNSELPAKSTKPGAQAMGDGPVLVRVEDDETAVKYSVDGVGIEKVEPEPRLSEMLPRRSTR
jgi:biopolymer transport protein ExbD